MVFFKHDHFGGINTMHVTCSIPEEVFFKEGVLVRAASGTESTSWKAIKSPKLYFLEVINPSDENHFGNLNAVWATIFNLDLITSQNYNFGNLNSLHVVLSLPEVFRTKTTPWRKPLREWKMVCGTYLYPRRGYAWSKPVLWWKLLPAKQFNYRSIIRAHFKSWRGYFGKCCMQRI